MSLALELLLVCCVAAGSISLLAMPHVLPFALPYTVDRGPDPGRLPAALRQVERVARRPNTEASEGEARSKPDYADPKNRVQATAGHTLHKGC